MSNFSTMAVFIICFHVILALTQFAMADISGGSGSSITLFTCKGSYYQDILSNGSQQYCGGVNENLSNAELDTLGVADKLPATVSNEQSGNFFLDAVASVAKFFKGVTGAVSIGVNLLIALVTAPYNFIKALGLPQFFTIIVGGAWYIIELLTITAFIFGRND
jgi:hypothetical protein